MANFKTIYLPYNKTGETGLYGRIIQLATGFLLDNIDGIFRAVPVLFDIPTIEIIQAPSVYMISENRTVWADGEYQAYGYDSINYLFAGATIFILNDIEVSQATLLQYMEILKKIEEGNWELVGNKWIYYDTNGSTVLMEFNVKDSVGNPSMTSIFKRERII